MVRQSAVGMRQGVCGCPSPSIMGHKGGKAPFPFPTSSWVLPLVTPPPPEGLHCPLCSEPLSPHPGSPAAPSCPKASYMPRKPRAGPRSFPKYIFLPRLHSIPKISPAPCCSLPGATTHLVTLPSPPLHSIFPRATSIFSPPGSVTIPLARTPVKVLRAAKSSQTFLPT